MVVLLSVGYKELLSTCVNRKLVAKEERIWETFCKLDLNGDGRITVEEIGIHPSSSSYVIDDMD
jgi:Ca2+-binding EF-hand superfamily protein